MRPVSRDEEGEKKSPNVMGETCERKDAERSFLTVRAYFHCLQSRGKRPKEPLVVTNALGKTSRKIMHILRGDPIL